MSLLLIYRSAKGVRKQLVARGHDAETIKANRASIDERVNNSSTVANLRLK